MLVAGNDVGRLAEHVRVFGQFDFADADVALVVMPDAKNLARMWNRREQGDGIFGQKPCFFDGNQRFSSLVEGRRSEGEKGAHIGRKIRADSV